MTKPNSLNPLYGIEQKVSPEKPSRAIHIFPELHPSTEDGRSSSVHPKSGFAESAVGFLRRALHPK